MTKCNMCLQVGLDEYICNQDRQGFLFCTIHYFQARKLMIVIFIKIRFNEKNGNLMFEKV
jgi:hypothetical protein